LPHNAGDLYRNRLLRFLVLDSPFDIESRRDVTGPEHITEQAPGRRAGGFLLMALQFI
jgi:hypothetical protein